MIVNSVVIHENIVRRLMRLESNRRLAHAYLFVGPHEVGKSETALALAKALNCENQENIDDEMFCDVCPACKKVNAGSHPDVHVIQPDENGSIKIEVVRSILGRIKLKSFFAKKKIFIIKEADLFTIESANALLKTLEEPSENSLLILTTAVVENILDTVKSRCHTIRFLPFKSEELKNKLIIEQDMLPHEAHFLAYFSEGCFNRAIRLRDNGALKDKNKVIDAFILNENSEEYVKKVLADKAMTRIFLDVLLSWTRDAILLKSAFVENRIIHLDRRNDLERFQKNFSFDELLHLEEDIVQMFKMLAENFNLKIPLMIIKERIWVN